MRLIFAICLMALVLPASRSFAQPPDRKESVTRADWLTGSKLQQQLDSPVSIRWSGQPLRTALENLARAQRVAVFLDRRIDPGQPLELAVTDVPLAKAFATMAEHLNIGTTMLGPVAYFGPVDSARRLQTLSELARDEIRNLPREARAAWLRQAAWAWPALSTPRELLDEWERQTRLRVLDAQSVPHDLWPASDLPPQSAADRLLLLAAGFDLGVKIASDGAGAELIPIRGPVRLVRDYDAGAAPGQVVDKLAKFIPDAEFRVANGRLFVRGRWEDHRLVQNALAGKPLRKTIREPAGPAEGTKVYTLTIKNQPIGPLLKGLARQIGFELKFDEASLKSAGVELDQLVSFEVKNAPLEDLLSAALKPAGLTFRREGDAVVVAAP